MHTESVCRFHCSSVDLVEAGAKEEEVVSKADLYVGASSKPYESSSVEYRVWLSGFTAVPMARSVSLDGS